MVFARKASSPDLGCEEDGLGREIREVGRALRGLEKAMGAEVRGAEVGGAHHQQLASLSDGGGGRGGGGSAADAAGAGSADGTAAVAEMYEALPFPPRYAFAEAAAFQRGQPPIHSSLASLVEVSHFLLGGRFHLHW